MHFNSRFLNRLLLFSAPLLSPTFLPSFYILFRSSCPSGKVYKTSTGNPLEHSLSTVCTFLRATNLFSPFSPFSLFSRFLRFLRFYSYPRFRFRSPCIYPWYFCNSSFPRFSPFITRAFPFRANYFHLPIAEASSRFPLGGRCFPRAFTFRLFPFLLLLLPLP